MKRTIFNRIAPAITPDVAAAAKKAITELFGPFPFVTGLTADRRKGLVKINVGNKVFVEDALVAGRNNGAILPFYLSMDDLQSKMDSFEALDDLITVVDTLQGKLRDAQAVIGDEAYGTALSLYHSFEQALKDGVPGMEAICRQLGERFKGQGRNNNGKDAPKDGNKS